ncbi:MAG: UDP-2,4-diacetamido-2,4,6-trideoxy-beta-L-altropyranose hydrolase [Methylophaga sp.]|nr:UDP-2,4-diacetamido-2,4,6-trideoxy-beta-L-altropyranose hydrolase [Methylophaga sp.]
MNIVFRADSSTIIGFGHVMRCLTLADELRGKSANIIFISRVHEGNLNHLVIEKGYSLYELPTNKSGHVNNGLTAYSTWLGVSWQEDARQVKSILKKFKTDLLIVDNYSLDHQWENEIRLDCNKIMVIDDLADRKHVCDVLLDQTTGRRNYNYQTLVPLDTVFLLGSDYALLRPEFIHWRSYSLNRRKNPIIERILITFGGVDADNLSSLVLKVLEQYIFRSEIEISVVMGEGAPHINAVRTIASQSKYSIKTLINVTNMAEIMANSDLCIGAAGATSWERCCLGLPTLMIVIADNQRNIAQSLHEKESAILIESPLRENLLNAIKNLDISRMKLLSHNSSHLVDGQGVKRVADSISIL